MSKALKGQPQTIGPIQSTNGLAYNIKDMAEIFATSLELQFRPHTTPTNPSYSDYVEKRVQEYLCTPCDDQIPFTTPTEVKTIIDATHPKKAPGFDVIPNKAIKSLHKKAIILLTNIINACLRHHYFPSIWKHAAVILFKKPGKDPKVASNYRPISLLPSLSKILEKIINTRIKSLIEDSNLINANQYGFRRGHSTTHQVHRIVETITNAFNHKNKVAGVFLDIEKAFDSLWHPGLIYKMVNYHFPNSMIRLINSFLTNRTFQVRIDKTYSTIRPIRAGVPQGSINGPVLFNIYINDFPQPPNCTVAQFADDTALLAISKRKQRAMLTIQSALQEVEAWTTDWKVKINATKSEAIIFQGTNKQGNPPPPVIHGQTIPYTKEVKYLGVHLDERLTFRSHITKTVRKAQVAAIALNPIIGRSSQLPLITKRLIYLTMIKPILLYACPAWATTKRTNRKKLQTLQNKCLRRMTGAPWFVRNQALHRDLEIDTIDTAILAAAHNHFQAVENSEYNHIAELSNYDPTADQPFKRPRSIHHNAMW